MKSWALKVKTLMGDDMTEEFKVHLARAVKEAQQDEKHCYHCSCPEHFICKCPLLKASRSATHLNQT